MRYREFVSRYFVALARSRTAAAIIRIRAASVDFAVSLSSADAIEVRAARRLAPVAFSAASRSAEIFVVRAPSRPFSRTSWSRYDRTTGNAAGQTIFGWSCGLSWLKWTSFAAAISFCEMSAVGVSSKMSSPRAISEA